MTKVQSAAALSIFALFAIGSACSAEKKTTEAGQSTKSNAQPLAISNFEIDTQLPDGGAVLEADFTAKPNGKDWDNLPESAELKIGFDKATGTDDDSLAGGVKEDTDQPGTTTGSIPNNKDDLTRFFVADEFLSGKAFLYLGFTRQNEGGSANQIFEFNHLRPAPGKTFAARTAGDLLIAFDWAGGGSKPQIGLHHWLTGGGSPSALCEAANKFPCWGKRETLDPQYYEASVNNGNTPFYSCSIPDAANKSIIPHPDDRFGCNVNIGSLRFGEAAINLTDSGILTGCDHFGSAWLRSRSSTSFSSQSKDFIAPIPIDINPCKYKVITFVCNQGNNTLHAAQVSLGGETKTSAIAADLPATGIDESVLCGLGADAGAVFPDRPVGAVDGGVCIPRDSGDPCP